MSGDGGMNSILRVIVENMIYPITLDVLQQVAIGNKPLVWYYKWVHVVMQCSPQLVGIVSISYG